MPITHSLRRELWVPRPLPETFDFFSRVENLQRITPPWLGFRILSPLPLQMKPGAVIDYSIRIRGIPFRWRTEIEQWNPPNEFVDVQAKGPYRSWRHRHRFALVNGGTAITDDVEYSMPFGLLGRLANRLQVSRDLARIFDYRTRKIQELL